MVTIFSMYSIKLYPYRYPCNYECNKTFKKDTKRNAKPWITNDILKLIKANDKTYKKLIKDENAVSKEKINKTYKQQ